jgi:hypothetical protein
MKKLRNSKASQFCRYLSKQPGRERLQEFACQIRETLRTPRTIPASGARISRRYNIPLDNILLALGYESSLVEMLGQPYGR